MWTFGGKPLDVPIADMEGFVYIITNNINGMKYIGKKSFWSRRKIKKAKRRTTLESDWKDYYGSSEDIQKAVKEFGKENFTRTILFVCKHKKTMGYLETKLQFLHDVLEKPGEYYNTNILGKYFTSEVDRLYKQRI